MSNDFVLSQGGKNLELLSSDIHDWNITFVDTGLTSNIGQRLKAVQRQLEGEEMFLANYTDGLSDVPLPAVIESFKESGNIACFVGVKPRASFHLITMESGGVVTSIEHIAKSGARMNGGFMVFRQEIFSYMKDGEELVEEPFRRLIDAGRLMVYPHDGYWACMDTFKEKQDLEDLFGQWHRALGGVESSARNQEMISCNLSRVKRVLCLGAHSDDIEIGCGGTVLRPHRAVEPNRVLLAGAVFRPGSRHGSQTQRERVPGASTARRRRGEILSRRISALSRSTGQRMLRRTQESLYAGCNLHPLPARSSPRPPPGVRVDVEHLSEPPHPRIRDPEI